jgi:TusA-related sulfurtransferase
MMAEVVDARGLSCPVPVVRAKAALEALTSGEVVVLVDEEAARENVLRLARSLGCLVDVSEEKGEFKLTISRKGGGK